MNGFRYHGVTNMENPGPPGVPWMILTPDTTPKDLQSIYLNGLQWAGYTFAQGNVGLASRIMGLTVTFVGKIAKDRN